MNSEEKQLLWKQFQAFLQFLHMLLSIAIFALLISAICGGTWLYLMKEVGLYHDHELMIGLWQSCFNLFDYGCPTETCTNLGTTVEDYIQATRAFLIMATLPSILAIVGALGMLCSERIKGQLSAICHLLTAVFVLIAMSVYTAKTNEYSVYDEFSYGWSYIVGWVAFVLAVAAAVIAIMFGAPKLPRVIIEFRN